MRNKNLFVLIHIRNKGKVGAGPQVNIYFTDRSKALLLLWIFLLLRFMSVMLSCLFFAALW